VVEGQVEACGLELGFEVFVVGYELMVGYEVVYGLVVEHGVFVVGVVFMAVGVVPCGLVLREKIVGRERSFT